MQEATHERQPFRWLKRGRIFCADGRYDWMQTHAQNPTVLVLADRLRIYFNVRPKRSADGLVTALATFLDVERNDPGKIISVHDKPILELGEAGTFDQFGAMVRSVLMDDNEVKLYYGGWNRCIGVPFNHAIGMAASCDGGITFSRFSKGPILSRTYKEPFLQNSPYVMKVHERYYLWYGIGLGWIADTDGTMESIYVMAQATSNNGIDWERNGLPCLPFLTPNECQTNASVIPLGDRYHMWFSHRHATDFRNKERGYRMGYAWSTDLQHWHRDDALGDLPFGNAGEWDAEMICYPCVVEVDGKVYMFYCGNGFGETGFGYAELAAPP